MFSKKCFKRGSITFAKDDKILSENLEVVETFNIFFSNIVKKMNIFLDQELLTEVGHIEDPVLRILERFKKQTSVVIILENHKEYAFSFMHVSLDEITKEIKTLDVKNNCQDMVIATKIIKRNSNIFADFFFLNLSNCIASSVYRYNSSTQKKDLKNAEPNYKPVSVLANILNFVCQITWKRYYHESILFSERI